MPIAFATVASLRAARPMATSCEDDNLLGGICRIRRAGTAQDHHGLTDRPDKPSLDGWKLFLGYRGWRFGMAQVSLRRIAAGVAVILGTIPGLVGGVGGGARAAEQLSPMVARCEGYLRFAAGELADDDYAKVAEFGTCLGYLEAIAEVSLGDRTLLKRPFCPPDSISYLKMAEDFVSYSKEHPSAPPGTPTSVVVRQTFVKLYPCR